MVVVVRHEEQSWEKKIMYSFVTLAYKYIVQLEWAFLVIHEDSSPNSGLQFFGPSRECC